jgi:hypothetical protein
MPFFCNISKQNSLITGFYFTEKYIFMTGVYRVVTLHRHTKHSMNCDSSVSTGWMTGVRFPATMSRPALEPNQAAVQWIPEALSPEIKGLSM